MARLLTLRRSLARLLTRDEVDDNFVNVASDFSGAVDPATLTGAYVAPYMRWADTGTGWLKRRNAANNAWEPEQRLLRRTVQPFGADELPTVDSGPVYVKGQGMAEWDADAGKYRVKSPVPVGAVSWWPLRTSIPASRIPADGQTISRATFPDLAAMVAAGTVPVVSEADWLADPLKRGAYTLGDGSTTIRVPDYNGKSAGSLGRVFLSGDGTNSAGTAGLIQRDALQNITGTIRPVQYADSSAVLTGAFAVAAPSGAGSLGSAGSVASFSAATFDASRVARTAAETRPTNVAGVWTIQAFGAVTNPGSADAAQLASDYAALNAAFQTLQGQVMGVGQSLQTVTASRILGVNYVNTTGRPIYIYVQSNVGTSGGYLIFWLNDLPVGMNYFFAQTTGLSTNGLVPPGASYRVTTGGATLTNWLEYR